MLVSCHCKCHADVIMCAILVFCHYMCHADVNFLLCLKFAYVLYFRNFIESFISFSKPLIGVVNGPAVGVAVTTMGLFDIVYSTDRVSR